VRLSPPALRRRRPGGARHDGVRRDRPPVIAGVVSSRRFAAAVVALLGVATVLRCVNLTAPWGADNLGTAGALFSIAARNHLAYGYRATGLVPVVTAEGPPSPL